MRDPYYDIPGLSASGISAFYRSPQYYWNVSPFNPDRKPTEETPALVFGRLAHCMVLTPTLMHEFAVAPDLDRRTKLGKEEWQAFELSAEGRAIVTADQFSLAVKLRDAMMANGVVRQLLGDGTPEEPVTWRREEGGILCKAKLDYLRHGLVLDYKTTTDTRLFEFSRTIAKYGYHRQKAWYMEGAEHRTGERPRGAVIIAQDKEMPDDIGVFALDAEAISQGMIEAEAAYHKISERLQTGDWSSHPAEIQEVGLPGWYVKTH